MAKKVEHEGVRINKIIGDSGFCSRRDADKLITDHRVTINGELATLGSRVVEGDKVKIDGEPLFFIPMEMREYKLRRYGSSRRAVREEGASEVRSEERRKPLPQEGREATTRMKKAVGTRGVERKSEPRTSPIAKKRNVVSPKSQSGKKHRK